MEIGVMQTIIDTSLFTHVGFVIKHLLFAAAGVLTLSALVSLFSGKQRFQRGDTALFSLVTAVFIIGFLWICWFHYQLYTHITLELPADLATWLNSQLARMNRGAAYGLPLYDPAHPPRYTIPVWIENEKYYFWFMCYAIMGLIAYHRQQDYRFRAVLQIFMGIQVAILVWATDPFSEVLPKFFSEIGAWFTANLSSRQRIGLFMQLYPKMNFYYNAQYMWLHPPMLFLAYASITITFITSVFMLIKRQPEIEQLGYDYAKFGYFMLTLGMLLGYPWALQAWGPNWWWDPKICSSIMMWAVFSTYLHTRLYANKPAMWYFSSMLGILCFIAMIFTFLASFFFPGEHTFQ